MYGILDPFTSWLKLTRSRSLRQDVKSMNRKGHLYLLGICMDAGKDQNTHKNFGPFCSMPLLKREWKSHWSMIMFKFKRSYLLILLPGNGMTRSHVLNSKDMFEGVGTKKNPKKYKDRSKRSGLILWIIVHSNFPSTFLQFVWKIFTPCANIFSKQQQQQKQKLYANMCANVKSQSVI